tara:strand:- start:1393 stop:1818 length:426 start_codon:yes stop_codon:yes gene_type:complete
MKVTGASGPSSSSSTARPSRSSGGFALPATGGAAPTAPTAAAGSVSGVAGVSALMALQGVEDVTERRRAIRRGNGLLDRLEEVKLALLSGEADEHALERLARTLREERTPDGDPGLDGLLDQIDLRAAVELAKADLRRSAT